MADTSVNDNVRPYRMVLIIDMAAEINEAFDLSNAIVLDAEKRGAFVHYVTMDELDSYDVVTGSPLHEALTGQPASNG